MSSHHFVKENQEPFLFVKGNNFPFEIVEQLLEWNPSVICDTNSIQYFIENSKKADYVFIKNDSLLSKYANPAFEIIPYDNCLTFKNLIEFVQSKKSNSLNVVCENVTIEFQNYAKNIFTDFNIYFFDFKQKLYKKPTKNFSKWQNKGQLITLFDTKGVEIESFTTKIEGVLTFPPQPVYWILESF
jgi:hypothetical protein